MTLDLETVVDSLFALDLAPGMAVVVVRDDKPPLVRGLGSADITSGRPFGADSQFYIASATKSFVGLAFALLHERGAPDLDSPIARYLPSLRLQPPLDPAAITLRQLLTHTHGIDDDGPVVYRTAYSGDFTNEQLITLLADHKPASAGTAHRYGNVGYLVAGLALDAVTGDRWKNVLQREVFDPLGLRHTTAYRSRSNDRALVMPHRAEGESFFRIPYFKCDDNMHAAGGMLTTPSDMARWLRAHIDEGFLDGRQVLPNSAFRMCHRAQVAAAKSSPHGWDQEGYGFGWQVARFDGDAMIMHGGGFPGFVTHMSFMPARRQGVAVMVNEGFLGTTLCALTAQQIYRCLASGQPPSAGTLRELATVAAQQRARLADERARRLARPQTLPFPIDAYAGVFEHRGYGRVELVLVEGKLEAHYGRMRSATEVFDSRENELRVEVFGSGSVMRVAMADGRATTLHLNGASFERVAD